MEKGRIPEAIAGFMYCGFIPCMPGAFINRRNLMDRYDGRMMMDRLRLSRKVILGIGPGVLRIFSSDGL